MAHVVLPHSVNVEPRQISGKYPWSTQKMAIKDAAFQAYVRLYEAGLINKNLLPTALPDLVITEMDFDKEEDRMLRARPRIDPWTCSVADRKNACQQVLTVKTDIGSEEPLPQIHLLVPKTIEISTAFKLFWSAERHINVDVHREQVANAFLQNDDLERLGRLSTQRLLESVFMSKMHGSSGIPPTSSVLVLPFLEIKLLQKWLTQCTGDILEENLNKLQPEQALIRIKRWTKDARPYVFQSLALRPRESHWIKPATESHEPPIEVHFEARRVPKRLDYLHPPGSKDFDKAVEFVPAAECYFDRLPAVYVKLMLLLPSILHKIEIRMVAVALNRSLLTSVAFRNLDLVEQAICASAANERSNYQRLELIGDSILKFWTSAQLCAQFPRWHEGYLSAGKDRVVSNAHLCRAATDHGLDAYIHTEPFAGSRWKPAVFGFSEHQQAVSKSRTLSSKVLADVVEALIGASFLDAKDEQERIVKVKACLARFLVGVPWESPIKNASTLRGLVPPEDFLYTNFIPLTEVTGYSFGKIILLIEALTHPSASPVGIQGSYQRLEFLGDSILDFIVVETMASHSRGLSHFTMHLIRAAVVNAHLLAFYCLGTSLEQDLHDLTTDAIFGEVEYRTTRKKTYLWQHMKHSSRLELVETQKACAKRYDELNSSIRRALESGKNHPWHLLLSLDAPKFFSDIIESILGAIFIDSKGNMQACKEFLERLGLLGYLRRIMAESIDIMHPKERLGIVGGNSTIEYVSAREVVDGAVCHSCTVLVDDVTKATSRGEVNRAAAEAKAAEEAVALLLTEKQSGGYGQDK